MTASDCGLWMAQGASRRSASQVAGVDSRLLSSLSHQGSQYSSQDAHLGASAGHCRTASLGSAYNRKYMQDYRFHDIKQVQSGDMDQVLTCHPTAFLSASLPSRYATKSACFVGSPNQYRAA